ncbi:MAG TPA: hypothetical protein VKV25_01715, partial [Acidimicrobiales bacterium]|nr:hypothetical protein [Acidimicrobiales bacterium]
RLFDLAQRLRGAREELAVVDEQLQALSETAEDARVRSLVSETPLAHREYTEARRHLDALGRAQRALASSIAEMQANQDELLDRLLSDDHQRR